jgi:ATP-dependent protease HslVU (ClpYQ) peptidase subunit
MVKTRSLEEHPENFIRKSLEFVKEVRKDKQKFN